MTGNAAAAPAMRLVGGGSAFRPELLALIEQVELLSDLSGREIELIAGYMQAYEADPGCMVFHEGDPGSHMGLLVHGRVAISKEGEGEKDLVISTEGRGRSIGEMALIDGEPRSASCVVVESATILLFTRDQFTRLISEHPALACKLLMRITRLMSRRLRMTSGQLVDHLM